MGTLTRFGFTSSVRRIDHVSASGRSIATAADAYERIRAGASLVQLYTAMIYEGPTIARCMARGLAELLKADGFASIADAVGADDK